MSNRHVWELSRVWMSLVKDIIHSHPTLETELIRDNRRLTSAVKAEGIRVFLEYLPAIGKHFDRCLAAGKYDVPSIPLTKRRNGMVVTPKFLGGLHLLVFTEDGSLREDVDMDAVLFIRQLTLFAKKAVYPCPSSAIETSVVEMVEHDASLPEPDSFWSDAGIPVQESGYDGFQHSRLLRTRVQGLSNPSLFLANLDMVSRLVSSSLGPYRFQDWRFRHGPGAVSEKTGSFDKYQFANWSEILETEFPIADCGYHSYSSWAYWSSDGDIFLGALPPLARSKIARTPGGDRDCPRIRKWASSDESGNPRKSEAFPISGIRAELPHSRLVAVPKSYRGPRLIAAEPSEHQWCQQNIWHYMRTRVAMCWIGQFIRFDDQSRNQALCTLGSDTGALATIDLSMASDCVTPHVVGNLFGSNPGLLRALRATRTQFLEQNLTDKVESRIKLRKYSTMGNATTFPVESLVFLSISLAAILMERGLSATKKNILPLTEEVTIFGDDIIIPKDSRAAVVQALEALYFKVNADKSFWEGNFRESCGVDSFRGCDVTPIYWKTYADGEPESIVSVVATRNRFYNRFYLETAAYLESTIPGHLMPRVSPDSGVFGLVQRMLPFTCPLPRRYNKDLHRWEVRTLVPKGRQRKTKTEDDFALHQFFTENPDPLIKWEAGFARSPVLKIALEWVDERALVAQANALI